MIKQPSYRFAGYTDSWEEKKLGEVSTHRGGTSIEKYFAENGVYKVISIGSYGLDGEYIDQGIRAISNEVTDKKIVRENELTMVLNDKTSNGTIIGRALLIKSSNEFVVNQRTEIISPKEILDSRYAYVLLNGNFREQVKKIVQGGTQIYVNYSSVEQLKLPLPSLPEQTAIASFFQDIDQLISLQQRKLEVLKEEKKTYLNLLFPAKGQKKPALRFAGFEDDWKEVKLGEVFDIVTDYVANGSFESLRNNVKTYEKDNFAYMIRLQDASNSWKGPWLYTDEKGYNFLSKSRLFKDDILMSNVGTVGRFFQVPELDRPMTLAPNSVLIRSTSSNNQFLYFMMLTANIQDQITMKKTPGVQDKINKTDFKKVIATLPALPEQEAIGYFFQDLDKAITKQEEKVNQLKESKQTLLRKMFI